VARRERSIGGVWIFIEFSQETSCWAQIQISDNVRCQSDNVRSSRTKSGGSRLCPPDTLGWRYVVLVGIYLNWQFTLYPSHPS
jgi:hypothetical protein